MSAERRNGSAIARPSVTEIAAMTAPSSCATRTSPDSGSELSTMASALSAWSSSVVARRMVSRDMMDPNLPPAAAARPACCQASGGVAGRTRAWTGEGITLRGRNVPSASTVSTMSAIQTSTNPATLPAGIASP